MTTTEFSIEQAVSEIADQFRAIKARNVRWSLTSIPLLDLQERYEVDRDDAFVLRELAFEEVTPRLVELPTQKQGRGADLAPRAGRSGYHSRKAVVHGAWLANPHISVDEVSAMVGIHPSTARLYLRELRTQHI